MSGLLHLVEAATALTKLGSSNLPPSTVYQAASSSAAPSTLPPMATSTASVAPALIVPAFSRKASTHSISDDDDTMANSNGCTKIATLRENHLEALRAAAVNAGLVTAPAPTTQPPVSAYTNQPAMPTPAVSVSPQYPFPQQVTTTIRIPRGDASKEMFPMRLHALLADPTVRDVISWLPHGKSFVVLRPDVFATRVLPLYFAPEGSNSLNAKKDVSQAVKNKKSQGVHKYPSFTRKLNRWGFRQISRGPDAGAFCHELFQRDDPELSRGMVCQKSRKSSRKSLGGGGFQDDMMSVSSASTMGTKSIASCEKRPYSSTVTVSTAGNTSNKSLPFKKRKSGQHVTNNYMVNDIPPMISHRNQKMPASTSSVTESDMTSDSGSVCSSNNTSSKSSDKATVPATAASNTAQAAEVVAREALARHFHEQHRAFALASLMENSRLAMQAVGIQNQACPTTVMGQALAQQITSNQQYSPVLGAMTTHSPAVFAPTVTIPQDKKMPSTANAPTASVSSAEAAKNALYKAYLQAVSNNNTSFTSS